MCGQKQTSSQLASLPRHRVGPLGSVIFWQQWRGTINNKQPWKIIRTFLRFLWKSKKHDFTFFDLLHTFSRTLDESNKTLSYPEIAHVIPHKPHTVLPRTRFVELHSCRRRYRSALLTSKAAVLSEITRIEMADQGHCWLLYYFILVNNTCILFHTISKLSRHIGQIIVFDRGCLF